MTKEMQGVAQLYGVQNEEPVDLNPGTCPEQCYFISGRGKLYQVVAWLQAGAKANLQTWLEPTAEFVESHRAILEKPLLNEEGKAFTEIVKWSADKPQQVLVIGPSLTPEEEEATIDPYDVAQVFDVDMTENPPVVEEEEESVVETPVVPELPKEVQEEIKYYEESAAITEEVEQAQEEADQGVVELEKTELVFPHLVDPDQLQDWQEECLRVRALNKKQWVEAVMGVLNKYHLSVHVKELAKLGKLSKLWDTEDSAALTIKSYSKAWCSENPSYRFERMTVIPPTTWVEREQAEEQPKPTRAKVEISRDTEVTEKTLRAVLGLVTAEEVETELVMRVNLRRFTSEQVAQIREAIGE